MQAHRIFHVLVLVKDGHQHTDQGTCKELFLANVPDFKVACVVIQIKVEKRFFK